MRQSWTKHLKREEDKEAFRRKLKASGEVLEREADIVREWLEAEFNASIGDEDFGSPNWAAHQAYRKGKMRAYKELISLLEGLTNK